ncbi:T9SS type B sorting domain-containing protein [Pedobacter sp. BS3]|uniref:T9SS type B sorting domain-containing protein n=1 Tax=Pedobacter sp. BS3 TaxID=2567937 RepID=UPI0011F05B7A|nr:gliding motility-associated C-terminal domain-containing protein [Pedobacter sp. BS3]TZF83282.1 T9SS type B sorting domain-containing protein [Pedobacter sp. BS3]
MIKKWYTTLLLVTGSVITAFAQSVVVNKVYNASSDFQGYGDAVELLVIQDHLDMRGLIIKDISLPDANTDAGGRYQFNSIDFWKDMRSGTTIVLRRPASASATYTEDTDASDYTLDLILANTTAGSDYFTVLQENPGGQYFNITANDIVIIKKDDGTANGKGVGQGIHAFAIGNSNTSAYYTTLVNAEVPVLYASGTTGTGYYQYPQNPDKALSDYTGTKATSSNASGDLGWGVGLGQNNIDYIASLRTLFVISAPADLLGFYTGATSLKLTWADKSNNETGFEIEKSVDGITFTSLATVAANINTYTVNGITQSQTAYYRVRALNPSGNSSYSNVFSTATITTAPVVVNKIYNATSVFEGYGDAVELLVVQDHYDMRGLIVKDVSLPDANTDGGGKYQFNTIDFWKDMRSGTTIVLRRPASAGATYTQDTDASDFTLDLLLPNTTSGSAYFTVLQENPGGQYFNITANDIVIIKKDDGTANGKGVGQAIHAFAIGNSTTSAYYTTLVNAGVPVLYASGTTGTGYYQYPQNPDKAISDYDGTKATSSNAAGDLGWGVGLGQNNIDYIESLRKLAKFPPPSGLVAEVLSLAEIRVSWTDNTTTETGFELERSTDGTTFTLLTTLPANVVTYTDNTVTAGTHYYYRARAVAGTDVTPYSNVSDVTAGTGIITGLNFSPVALYENQPSGTPAGTLSVTSPDVAINAIYTLVSGAGADDNAQFKLSGNQLQTNATFDYETKQTYHIRIKATSQTNFSLEQAFAVTVNDVNEAPTITAVGSQDACVGTDEKIIALSGITAGPESVQTVTATVSSDNAVLFDALTVSLLSGGKGEIRYRLKNPVAGTVNITVQLQDNGGTANGGTDTHAETFLLNIHEFPVVTITSDKGASIDRGVTVKLTASGGTGYQWESADGIVGATNTAELLVRPAQTTTYRVTATNSGGCSTMQEFTVNVKTNYDLVVADNLLSPNGDGLHDYWKIDNIDLYPDNEVKVFDKSGRVVYSKKGYNNEWDGRISGTALKEDTYYYLIDFGPGKPKKKGFISILTN